MTSAGIIIILVIISWRQRNWVVVGFNVPRLPLLLLSAASMFGDNSQRQRCSSAAAAPAQTTTKPILRSNCDAGSAASANGQKQRCNPVPVRVLVCVSGSHGCMCVSRATICGASCALSAARNSWIQNIHERKSEGQHRNSADIRLRPGGADAAEMRESKRERPRERLANCFTSASVMLLPGVLLTLNRAAPTVLLNGRSWEETHSNWALWNKYKGL